MRLPSTSPDSPSRAFALFLSYRLAGIIMCNLIITIPFGLRAFNSLRSVAARATRGATPARAAHKTDTISTAPGPMRPGRERLCSPGCARPCSHPLVRDSWFRQTKGDVSDERARES
jgi:hypothetical protein